MAKEPKQDDKGHPPEVDPRKRAPAKERPDEKSFRVEDLNAQNDK